MAKKYTDEFRRDAVRMSMATCPSSRKRVKEGQRLRA